MQVVLLERVEKLGQIGDVVNVKPGFARNFLLPQNKALRATDDNIAYFNAQKETLLAANAARRGEAETQAKKLAGQKFVLLRNASEVGMLFGSVGARDVVEAAADAGFTLARAHVKLDQGIKTLGVFEVNVAPHPEVLIQVTVNIARSKEEAEEQFKTGQMYVRKPDEQQSAPRRNSRRKTEDDTSGDLSPVALAKGEGEQPDVAVVAETV